MAPDSARVISPSVIMGAVSRGWRAFSSGGARRGERW